MGWTNAAELDGVLSDYFHAHYTLKHGKGVSHARDVFYGIVNLRAPEYKHKLPNAKLSIQGWEKGHPPVHHPPLTWNLAVAIAVNMVSAGEVRMAIGALLQFECYLRVGEMLNLRREDVADVGDDRLDDGQNLMVLRLRKTKTGSEQDVTVRDAQVAGLLRGLLRLVPPGAKLFDFTAGQYRTQLHRSCANLGLSDKYVTHSFRHGGATRDMASGLLGIEDVMLRGRWESNKSCRIYIQRGTALRMAMTAPPGLASAGRRLARNLARAFTLAQ
jgi:integrase